jgi:hypothetical protein
MPWKAFFHIVAAVSLILNIHVPCTYTNMWTGLRRIFWSRITDVEVVIFITQLT